jgi:response regulator RpfG family c-di-GMP phosphodiesterase
VPGWLTWLVVGLLAWALLAIPLSLFFARFLRLSASSLAGADTEAVASAAVVAHSAAAPIAPQPTFSRPLEPMRSRRILIVDDDAALRALLRTTLTAEFEVAEAADAERASDLARLWRPTLVLLDVAMPGLDGLSFCSDLKRKQAYGAPLVVLLTGSEISEEEAIVAGADSLLRKPFSPLELVGVIDRLTGTDSIETGTEIADKPSDQVQLYARDLSRLVEIERMQRRVVQDAYRETVTALANALEAKDTGTGTHSLRVRHYAANLTAAVDPALLTDASLEYGFLLHDVGKIGVPNELLEKRGPLSPREMELMRMHPVIGAEILADVTFLQGEGLNVIRSHHEHWDGTGYPDRLAGGEIPLSARIFAVADALDAMTGERPYRRPASWSAAAKEISSQSGRQFDPDIVEVFRAENDGLRRLFELTTAA